MTIVEKLKAINAILFSSEEQNEDTIKFLDVKTADNRILRVDDLVEQSKVEEILEDGTIQALDNGDYTLETGVIITVEEGIIAKIIEAPEADAEVEGEPSPEGDVVDSVDAVEMVEYPLADGTMIKVAGELVEGAITDAPNGEHILADGSKIIVEEGVIVSIASAIDEEMESEVVDVAPEVVPEVAPIVDETEEDKEMKGVLANLKELIKQVKDLKASFEVVEKENKELKAEFSKIAKLPSDEKTDREIKFSNEKQNKQIENSPLKRMFGK